MFVYKFLPTISHPGSKAVPPSEQNIEIGLQGLFFYSIGETEAVRPRRRAKALNFCPCRKLEFG